MADSLVRDSELDDVKLQRIKHHCNNALIYADNEDLGANLILCKAYKRLRRYKEAVEYEKLIYKAPLDSYLKRSKSEKLTEVGKEKDFEVSDCQSSQL